MGFELHITCSRDIEKISIDFSDGTVKEISRNGGFLDTEYNSGNISEEILEKPDVTLEERPVKVAPELQNLNF